MPVIVEFRGYIFLIISKLSINLFEPGEFSE